MSNLESAKALVPLLRALHEAEARGRDCSVTELASQLDCSEHQAEQMLSECSDRYSLSSSELDPPLLYPAGRQFLLMDGRVSQKILEFLPGVIDDLHARKALLDAGSVVVDLFRVAWLEGRGVEHARDLVPDAFRPAIDERIALDLFAASVALVARLTSGRPAACVGEELMAVELINQAKVWLEMECDKGAISPEEQREAAAELKSLFELFEDDDVLNLFEMSEPADAAMSGHSPINRELGVADQRIEAWFSPLHGEPETGYLHLARD